MGTIRFSDRRIFNALASLGLLVGMALPAFIPSFASAAEITTRSIALSTAASGATSVTYNVTFTPISNAAGFLIDFCSQTPLVQQTCTAPSGLSTSGVGTTTGGATVADIASHDGATDTATLTGGTPYTVALTGITNPSSVGTFYARIVTYDTSAHLTGTGHPTDNTTETAGATDSGGVALSINNTVNVTAAVMESMTFCVAGGDTSLSSDKNCSNAATINTSTPPNLDLGVTSNGATALQSNTLSTGTIYTQLTTNAAHGAVVNLKSSATSCGGLMLAGDATHCYISPSPSSGFTAGTADFGVKLGTAAGTASDSNDTGTYQAANGSSYGSTNYFMNFVAGNASGVTGPYGDPILDSAGAPIDDENMPLTFGASINNSTPAGLYSANLNLIATGTF